MTDRVRLARLSCDWVVLDEVNLEQAESKRAVATLSVAARSALVLGEVFVGLVTGSVRVLSEAVHSGVDLVAAAIALFSVHQSANPADSTHPCGHGKVENISGLVEALLIFVAAGWVICEAVQELLKPELLTEAWLRALVMAASAAVNMIVSQRLFLVARATESIALEADAWHLHTDVYTSAGVMGELALIAILQWELAGHADLATTQRYADMVANDLTAAMDAFSLPGRVGTEGV